MERNWTNIGADYCKSRRPQIERAIDALTWEAREGEKPMMPALGINAAITELRLPKVTQIAISSDLAPNGLYGIECNYSNGRARVYVLDQGSELIPLASDFYGEEGEAA